jgi:hypothetical protein
VGVGGGEEDRRRKLLEGGRRRKQKETDSCPLGGKRVGEEGPRGKDIGLG